LRYTTPPNENCELRISDFEIESMRRRSSEGLGLKSGVAKIRNSNFAIRNSFSALHTDHLFDLGNDFNQIFLILHHRLD
jgi:hypothetical protein